MKLDANDPRWTAYALGELENETDKAELEAALEQDPELRIEVEEIRSTARLLADRLREEPVVGLSTEQRRRISARMDGGRRWFGLRPSWVFSAAASAAALLLVILVGPHFLRREAQNPRQGASTEKNPRIAADRQTSAQAALPLPVPERAKEIKTPAAVAPQRAQMQIKKQPLRQDQVNGAEAPAILPPAQVQLAQAVPIPENLVIAGNPIVASGLPVAAGIQPKPAIQSASLTGVLVDQSGAVIPGGEVRVSDDSTGAVFKAVTTENGTFSIPKLQPGPHTLTANVPGFKPSTLKGIVLQEGVPGSVKMTMLVGGSNETVTVTAGAVAVQSSSATISSSVRPQVTDLPVMGRTGFGPGFAGGMGGGRGVKLADPINITIDGIASAPPAPGKSKDGVYSMTKPLVDSIDAAKMTPTRIQELQRQGFNTEAYDHIRDNPFQEVKERPLSTFSIDVDTASYANVRRFLNQGQLPPKDAVRIEEMLNYFSYEYPGPIDGKPFAANFEITDAPWNPEHRLLRIGLKAREIKGRRPPCNLVFLLDVSGSMGETNKLPLVKEAMLLLVDQLTEDDTVSIVTYASESGLRLPRTRGDQKARLRYAISSLQAGGSTNGASGIQLAYETALAGFVEKGINRVILATDGDFNVGFTSRGDLTRLIEEKRKSGIYLSALGFGMGNLKDATLEMLADKGNGNYAYIDTASEARKVLVDELDASLVTVAKDVKIQIEFNPAEVSSYRLIGYEDRLLRKEDFNNDAKDAGEIGAGHAVTVFYEIVPSGSAAAPPGVDPLKYQRPSTASTPAARTGELLTMKVRYKEPDREESKLTEFVLRDAGTPFAAASRDFKFAAAVVAFGMCLRDSPYKGRVHMEDILTWAKAGQGVDRDGYRREFIRLLTQAEPLIR